MLVITDALTKFVIAEPTRTVTRLKLRVLKRVFSLFALVSDFGKAFISRYFKRVAVENQFKHTLKAIACPRANGQVERTNRAIIGSYYQHITKMFWIFSIKHFF